MKKLNRSVVLRIMLVLFTVAPTVALLFHLFLPEQVTIYGLPLHFLRIMELYALGEKSAYGVFIFSLFELCCLLPVIGCVFAKRHRIAYILLACLPFAVSAFYTAVRYLQWGSVKDFFFLFSFLFDILYLIIAVAIIPLHSKEIGWK